MNTKKYPKGSEWRKWDLHVHTPYSLVQGFDGSSIDERWDNFIADLEALPEEFKVLGVNDYLFIEGYKKILQYRSEGRLTNIETILPVVEFRIKKFAGHKDFKRVNFHVIFSDELVPTIIENQFLNALTSKYQLTPGYNGIQWNGVITKESLQGLGAAIKASVPQQQLANYGTDLEEGFNNLNLDEEAIFTILNENTYLKGKSLTAIGKTEWESLSWNDQSIAEKKDIINKVDFVFISSDTAHACQNAKNKLTEQAVNNLLLDCSDAHYNSSRLSQKDRIGKCFTWIKADPTFNGLKQIVHEPQTRILIRDTRPDDKTDYNVIDKVRFVGTDGDYFSNDVIELNPNLNVIIGGKSSGKSLLLFHIAKTIDPVQVKEKLDIVRENEYDLKPKVRDFDFEVYWKDGHIDQLTGDTEMKNRQITYVPQMYINYLAEQKGEKKLADLIESILLQNDNFKLFHDIKTEEIQRINLEIANDINEIFVIKENYQQEQKEYKAIGEKSAITTNIATIQKEIFDLKSQSGFSPEDNKIYSGLLKRKELAYNSRSRLQNYATKLHEYNELLGELRLTVNDSITNFVDLESDFPEDHMAERFISKNVADDHAAINSAFSALNQKYSAIHLKVSEIVKIKGDTIVALDRAFEPYNAKMKSQELLKTLNSKLEQEKNKLKRLEGKSKQLQKIAEIGKAKKAKIFENSNSLFGAYNEILAKITKPDLAKIGNGLILETKLEINHLSFQNGFCSLLDGRSNFNAIFGDCFNNSNEYVYTEATHLLNLQSIYDKIWLFDKNNIKFRSGFGPKEAILQLLKDNFKFSYNILYNGDEILQMSPGKRGLVLMQIILHLSNAEHPILIDQPEDNLDNRTIYNDLNEFVKSKKIQRQIILVTHNANLVVSTDAEQVIIANQNGQDQGKSNDKFQFEYTSGSLENTFKTPAVSGILNQMGVREHVCDILEGGEVAFQYRERKYGFSK